MRVVRVITALPKMMNVVILEMNQKTKIKRTGIGT